MSQKHEKKAYHRGPRKKKEKRGIFGTVILIVALCVFGFSAFQLFQIFKGYKTGEDEYDDLQKVAITKEETDEDGKKSYTVDFDALREINPDVVAWIRFEEPAVINYPLVQGRDNEEYLHKTFKGYDNTVGTIFINVGNHPDFNDVNTIIYGHYMYNGTMFNELEEYKEEAFYKAHPFFYIYTPDGLERKYQIYSAGEVLDTSEGYTYEFADDAAFEHFVQTTKAASWYDTGLIPAVGDRIVTLSTCTRESNDNRTAIHGVLVEVNQ